MFGRRGGGGRVDGVLVSSSSGVGNQCTCSLGTVRVCSFEKEPGRLPLTQLARQYDAQEDAKGRRFIGAYTVEQRAARVRRFMELRRRRVWFKKVKYACRRRLASARLRYKGRFVRSIEDIPPEERHLYADAARQAEISAGSGGPNGGAAGASGGGSGHGGSSSKKGGHSSHGRRSSSSASSHGGAGPGGVYLLPGHSMSAGAAAAYARGLGHSNKTTRSGRASRGSRH